MSDSQQTGVVSRSSPELSAGADPASRSFPQADGRVLRIDPPEAVSQPSVPTSPAPEQPAPAAPHELLLSQTTQLVEHLRSQFAELHRRDQVLATQIQEIERDRHLLTVWRQDAEQEFRSKEALLRQREAALAEQIASQQSLLEQLNSEQAELAKRREQLEADRIRLFAEIGQKVAAERHELQLAIQKANDKQQELEAEYQRRQQVLEQEYRDRLNELERARSCVREQVTEEVLTAELRAERDRLAAERREFESQRAEFFATRDGERADLERAREVHEATVARFREELLQQRQQQIAELDRLRAEQESALQHARDEFARQREQQLSELRHERAVLENRLKFQQEHLAKARQEIEAIQADFRREAQRTRGQLEEGEAILRLRQSQLNRVRELLEERERSVDREREMLLKSQQAFDRSTAHDRERLKQDQEDWSRERAAQLADLRRQQEMLALHVQNLEGRRERLDRLRAELEETHRTTLEMRMAIEEAWTQLTQACGAAGAKERLEQAQQQLSGHYRHLREALAEQRRELEASRQQLQQQRDEFRREQQALSDWVAEKERTIRQNEAAVQHRLEQLHLQEAAWRSASQRWINEKIEAEAIIRDLLQQLTSLTEPTSQVSMWPNPPMPSYE